MDRGILIFFLPKNKAPEAYHPSNFDIDGVIESRIIESVDSKLAGSFLQALANALGYVGEINSLALYQPNLVGGQIQIIIYPTTKKLSYFHSTTSTFNRLDLEDFTNPSFTTPLLESGAYLQSEVMETVNLLGSVFFWKTIHNKNVFKSLNPKLMEFEYFPVQLAKDGDGLFFEERVISRLFEIGLIGDDSKIELIEDYGGWETLKDLTASMSIHYSHLGIKQSVIFLGTALVPSPPVTPTSLSDLIQERISFLRNVGVSSSFLMAEEGVVYHMKTTPFIEALRLASIDIRRELILQATETAAIFDMNFYGKPLPKLRIGTLGEFDNFIEISSLDDIRPQSDFVSGLGVRGQAVYWTDFSGNPRSFLDRDTQGTRCWQSLSNVLNGEELSQAYTFYESFRKQQGVHPQLKH